MSAAAAKPENASKSVEAAKLLADLPRLSKEVVQSVLGGMQYEPSKADQWSADIVERMLTKLNALVGPHLPYKFSVTAILIQKRNAGSHISSGCLYDKETDENQTMRWENESMWCFTVVSSLMYGSA
ncbi:hypothetical protein CAOG_00623 [Capsaspora owczarzaki ATCC 30864]|uniref:hypothetical protein n=1 Tax=Capsaspora owczarzaki (strain ATCC 30864) TaxID=595528 RepID=UPI0003524352|nr:hypothetical protein CAOG_00623 [Capsaspora owczarzaki ATCC 30864]|eukprot:XP_004365494.2 hypothetical protein CAOG_00623 [Capsaspora owczarzaki ATCC 30864]